MLFLKSQNLSKNFLGKKRTVKALIFQYSIYYNIIRIILTSDPEWVLNTHLLNRFQMPKSRNWVISILICAMRLNEFLAFLFYFYWYKKHWDFGYKFGF